MFDLNLTELVVLIFGIVEFSKKLNVSGKALTILGMVVGVVLGVVFKLTEVYPAIQPWVEIGFFGIASGLTASGLYDFFGKRFPRQP